MSDNAIQPIILQLLSPAVRLEHKKLAELAVRARFAGLVISWPSFPCSASTIAKAKADFDFQLLWQEKTLNMLTELQPEEAAEIQIPSSPFTSKEIEEFVDAVKNYHDGLREIFLDKYALNTEQT